MSDFRISPFTTPAQTAPVGGGAPSVTTPVSAAPVYQADQGSTSLQQQLTAIVDTRNQMVQALQTGDAQTALLMASIGNQRVQQLMPSITDPTLQAQFQQLSLGFQSVETQLMAQAQASTPITSPTPVPPAAPSQSIITPTQVAPPPAAIENAKKLISLRDQVMAALKAGDAAKASDLAQQGRDLAKAMADGEPDPTTKKQLQQAQAGFQQMIDQLGSVKAQAAQQAQHKSSGGGIFGFLGGVAHAIGSVAKSALNIVCSPLELVGKVLDPIRNTFMKAFDGVRSAIDNSIGKIPVLGSVVRFGTGLAAGAVGIVNGAVQAVTHPVQTITGVANLAWNLSGLIPFGPKMLWDMGVNGESPMQSWQQGLQAGVGTVTGIFGGAIQDAMHGNIAGALGQATADVGSFFVGAGAAKGAAVAGDIGDAGKVGIAANLAARGGMVGRIGSAAVRAEGLAGAVAGKVGAAASHLPGAARVSNMVDHLGEYGQLVRGGEGAAQVAGDFGRTARVAAVAMRPGLYAGEAGLKVLDAGIGFNRFALGKVLDLGKKLPLVGRVATRLDNSAMLAPLISHDGTLLANMRVPLIEQGIASRLPLAPRAAVVGFEATNQPAPPAPPAGE